MKTAAADMPSSQMQQPNSSRASKFDRTQRFAKQHSQGSNLILGGGNKATSVNTITRLSENSIKHVSTKANVPVTARGGSIPKVAANAAREFGREINQNSAMSAVSQQTGQILQGKLKPNQVVKKNIMTYRTNAIAEKPAANFSSTQSLGPLQSMQTIGPGQKQSLLLMKKKQTVRSSTEQLPVTASSLSASAKITQVMNATAKVSAFQTKDSSTNLIKLTKVEEGATTESTRQEDSKTVKEEANQAAETGNEPVAEVFKQRLVSHRRQISKSMVFSDQLEIRDPQMVAELATDIYRNMRLTETALKVDADYLTKVQLPTEVKDTSRAFLIEWIIDVHRKFRLAPETLYVTVFIIDRFLSLQQIKKSQLHILGVTALLISTKYEEIYPPELKDLLTVSENKFKKPEVLKMEQQILKTLQFDITSPSAYRFLERFRKVSTLVSNEDRVFYFAQYIQEIALLDASLLKYNSSELAAASLILATKAIKKVSVWNKEMERATEYTDEHLQPIAEDVKGFVLEVNPKFLTTLKYKFSKQEYKEVANLPFKF